MVILNNPLFKKLILRKFSINISKIFKKIINFEEEHLK